MFLRKSLLSREKINRILLLIYNVNDFISLCCRMDESTSKENLGIIVQYKVKVRVIVQYGG